MPVVKIIEGTSHRELQFSGSQSLRDILESHEVPIRSGCRGNGACGLCIVQIEEGQVNAPTANERHMLIGDQLERNLRLACQVYPRSDICIRLLSSDACSQWYDISHDYLFCAPERLDTGVEPAHTGFGLAVDLGTTHISFSLWDMEQGVRLTARAGVNPQVFHGSDVISRLLAAQRSEENSRKLGTMTLHAVREELTQLSSHTGVKPEQITSAVIAGNSAMLLLLTGTDPQMLLDPGSWTNDIGLNPRRPYIPAQIMGIHPQAKVETIPGLRGFVGSDLLTGVLATRLLDQPGGLFIDFGTNSEIALWDGEVLRVTSAAAGPAFESCGISCGMPAETGAAYKIGRGSGEGELRIRVMGGGEAKGICGSALIDLIALLRESRELTPTGTFTHLHPDRGFIVQKEPFLSLTRQDVDMVQRAKAAIGVGIRTLLARARMQPEGLSRVFICGAFGRHLDIRNAQRIGLLPSTDLEIFRLCGNTSLAGCELVLLKSSCKAELENLRRQTEVISLSAISDFETLFLENLYLRPLKVDRI